MAGPDAMEYWNNGILGAGSHTSAQFSIIPSFHHSNTPPPSGIEFSSINIQ
jgi:hypothetical protein